MTSLSHYLWLDVAVSAAEQDELALLQHSYSTVFDAEQRLGLDGAVEAADDAGGVVLRVDDADPRSFAGPLERAEWAYGHVHNTLMDGAHERGWHRLHAALLEVRGSGVIVAGPSGAGKTSLTVNAATQGALVHSDEGVFLADGRAVGLPRRLHLKDSARKVLDPGTFESAVKLAYPSPVWAVDPGAHWTLPVLRPLDIAAIIVLGDPVAPPAVRPLSSWQVLSALATESSMFSRRPERLIAELSRVAEATRCVAIDGYYGARGAEFVDALV